MKAPKPKKSGNENWKEEKKAWRENLKKPSLSLDFWYGTSSEFIDNVFGGLDKALLGSK